MSNLNQREAARFIGTWLNQKGYWELFPQDPALLLSENRRVTRQGNVIKYGRIPFTKDAKNRIGYDLADLQDLCNNKIMPICEELAKIRDEKAAVAAKTARLPYVN
jgi:hypothetical protein